MCTVNLEFYQCLFTIKLVCFITEQSHLRFAIPCTRQIISLTNLTPGSRTISSRIQTILTRALQFLNASPSATLQRQCYWLAPTTLACFVTKTIRICFPIEHVPNIRSTTRTTVNAYEHLRMSDDHFAIISN